MKKPSTYVSASVAVRLIRGLLWTEDYKNVRRHLNGGTQAQTLVDGIAPSFAVRLV